MERTALPALTDLGHWHTPDGLMLAVVHERYAGMVGQPRICLVDIVGRLHHYDEAAVTELQDPAIAAKVGPSPLPPS